MPDFRAIEEANFRARLRAVVYAVVVEKPMPYRAVVERGVLQGSVRAMRPRGAGSRPRECHDEREKAQREPQRSARRSL